VPSASREVGGISDWLGEMPFARDSRSNGSFCVLPGDGSGTPVGFPQATSRVSASKVIARISDDRIVLLVPGMDCTVSFASRRNAVLIDVILVLWYICTMVDESKFVVERVQTGVRMEKRILKVLKGFAEYHDMTLGDLLEGIVLHAFDGKSPFGAASLARIRELKKFYDLDLDSGASHHLVEGRRPAKPGKSSGRTKS
jgi:hypothetical protein